MANMNGRDDGGRLEERMGETTGDGEEDTTLEEDQRITGSETKYLIFVK